MKSILKILTIMIMFVVVASSAYALIGGSESTGGSTGSWDVASEHTNFFMPVPGLRISFVTASGDRIYSLDFIPDDTLVGTYDGYNIWSSKAVYFSTSMSNKVSYMTGKSTLTFNTSATALGNRVNKLSDLDSILEKYNYNINVLSQLQAWNYTNLFQPIFDTFSSNSDATKNFYGFLSDLGFPVENLDSYYDSNSKLYKVFMVFEPTSIVRVAKTSGNKNSSPYTPDLTGLAIPTSNTSYYYYGTAYELSVLGVNLKPTWLSVCTSDGFCDVSSALKKMSCASYITGDLFTQIKNATGATGDTIKIGNVSFSETSYFGNKILVKNKFSDICSNNSTYLDRNDATGKYGIGLGIAWIGDLLPTNISCDDIKKANSTLMSDLDKEYKKNGLNKIYENYKDGIAVNGQTASIHWFINECTCYGIYDYYDNNTLESYFEQNKVDSSDYPHIPLYETTASVIKTKFDSKAFNAYNDLISSYETNIFKVTPWSYDKYTNLSCGSKESYWCEDFNNWYDSNKSSTDPNLSTLKNLTKDYIINNYEKELTNMINKYNLIYFPAMNYKWSLSESKNTTNTTGQAVFSYIDNCVETITLNCDDINSFYPELQYIGCSRVENFDFGAYNKKNSTSVTSKLYVSECGCNKNPYNCTPSYNVSNCSSNTLITYKDSSKGEINDEYWMKCVFNDYGEYDIGTHKNSQNYRDNTLSNEYCDVYCIETSSVALPGGNINVEAGRYFVWGVSRVDGSRTCRTESIDYETFKNDLNEANEKAQTAYMKSVQTNNSYKKRQYQREYKQAIQEANDAINAITACYTWPEKAIYEVNPIVSIDYADGINYSYSHDLVGTTTYGQVSTSGTDCKEITVKQFECPNNGICRFKNVKIKQCTVVQMKRTATTRFSLPSNVYRYVKKDGNLSVMGKPTDYYRYIDIGVSNFPVSYSIADGQHGAGIDNSKLNITYSDLGHKTNTLSIDTILSATSDDFGKWYCKFNTYSSLINTSGIKLEYRLIDLVNPFPDINAGNRNTGSNWCTPDGNCKYNNSVVKQYISENRGVSDYEVYKIEPMYTFILQPSDILTIRKYNSKNSYTSYTGSYNGENYDYVCNTKTGGTCISEYFTTLLNMTDATGSCVARKYRTPSDSKNFDACRYLSN